MQVRLGAQEQQPDMATLAFHMMKQMQSMQQMQQQTLSALQGFSCTSANATERARDHETPCITTFPPRRALDTCPNVPAHTPMKALDAPQGPQGSVETPEKKESLEKPAAHEPALQGLRAGSKKNIEQVAMLMTHALERRRAGVDGDDKPAQATKQLEDEVAESPRRAEAKREADNGKRVSTPKCDPKGRPVYYLQGTIYTDQKCSKFRVKLRKGDRIDYPVSFRDNKAEAWRTALRMIDSAAQGAGNKKAAKKRKRG